MTDLDRLLEMKVSDYRVTEYTDARNIYGPEGVTETADKLIDDLIDDRRKLIERVKEAEDKARYSVMSRPEFHNAVDRLEARLRAAEEVLRVVRDSGTWAPTEIVMALEAYDEAVARVKE